MNLSIYKVALSERSETYIKTTTASANTSGGTLTIGIDDSIRSVAGMDKDSVFQIMDSIASAVSDSCEPQIVPDTSFRTIEGKCIAIAKIYAGISRPYYPRHIGKGNGTYICVAGTSRQADVVKLKELELGETHASWDKQVRIGYEVKKDAINKLCQDIHRYVKSAIDSSKGKRSIAVITVEHLLN